MTPISLKNSLTPFKSMCYVLPALLWVLEISVKKRELPVLLVGEQKSTIKRLISQQGL